jgi:RING-box protein 1
METHNSLSILIDSANIISVSTLNIHNADCPICRCSLNDKCLDCSNDDNISTNDCISVIGVCDHGYHMHCISSWIKTRNNCPLDNKTWEYKKHATLCKCSKKKSNHHSNNNHYTNYNSDSDSDSDSDSESEAAEAE